ncbi:MAG TPA: lipoyl synthase, partial [Candidatus Tenderia electrophaga]|nr:lipoyl synthase [Candidatus Tenderia electrophaga]
MAIHIPVFDHSSTANVSRMPSWIRQRLGGDAVYGKTASVVKSQSLNTVCEEAHCPNRAECWSRGTATFMLLGDTCTRACGFCNVKTGRPDSLDVDEPRRVAQAVADMGLDYVVLTSVNRDDQPDGGAAIYAELLRRLRQDKPEIGLEILTPDFQQGQQAAVGLICDSVAGGQLVWGHNIETVPALYKEVRKGSRYDRSLDLLALAAKQPGVEVKSALMLGLGESKDQVLAVLDDLRQAGVARVSLGQYLRPSRQHLPVKEYVSPETFSEYEADARAMGFAWV